MKYIGYIEICVGLGLGLGPVIGAVIYKQLEYEQTMYCFALLCGLTTLICRQLIPEVYNRSTQRVEIEILDETIDKPIAMEQENLIKEITWGMLLSNKFCLFTLVSCLIGTFNCVFWVGWLTTELGKQGFDEGNVGYVIGSQSFLYLLACILLPNLCEKIPRRLLFTMGMFGMGFTMLMMGPSKMFDFPVNITMIISAFPILGFF